ncbi:hypothetical protein D9X30_3309 [Cupriavidus sp. U2]|nr:hypothetical protein D9X30_3309 [Cupriavidus sp. U2]
MTFMDSALFAKARESRCLGDTVLGVRRRNCDESMVAIWLWRPPGKQFETGGDDMGLSYRKSISAGPFRFNISGKGVGVSVGVPGFRIGSGPRGHYVSVSAGGFTYRQSLGGRHRHSSGADHQERFPQPPADGDAAAGQRFLPSGSSTVAPLEVIQSADIGKLSDSSADALFSEIDAKSKMNPVWPIPLVATAVLAMLLAANNAEPANRAMQGVGLLALITVIVATVWLYLWDSARRSVVLIYDLEQDFNQSYERMLSGFDEMRTCNRAWRVEAEGRVLDGRYHAGAGSQVIRKAASMSYGNVAIIKCNIDVPSITTGRMRFFFYPDRILMEDGKRIAACSYQSLEAESGQTQFIESDNVPSDAEVIGHTWRYVNRNGSPDRRFKDNRQIPVVRYETLRLSTAQGVREMFHFSRLGCSGRFSALVSKDLAALGSKRA